MKALNFALQKIKTGFLAFFQIHPRYYVVIEFFDGGKPMEYSRRDVPNLSCYPRPGEEVCGRVVRSVRWSRF